MSLPTGRMFGYVCWALLAANLAACAGLMARGGPAPTVVRVPALAVPTIPLPGEASGHGRSPRDRAGADGVAAPDWRMGRMHGGRSRRWVA